MIEESWAIGPTPEQLLCHAAELAEAERAGMYLERMMGGNLRIVRSPRQMRLRGDDVVDAMFEWTRVDPKAAVRALDADIKAERLRSGVFDGAVLIILIKQRRALKLALAADRKARARGNAR